MRVRVVIFIALLAAGFGVAGFFVRPSRNRAVQTPAATATPEETPFEIEETPFILETPAASPTGSPASPPAATLRATTRPVPKTATPAPTPKRTPPPFPFSPLPTRSPAPSGATG